MRTFTSAERFGFMCRLIETRYIISSYYFFVDIDEHRLNVAKSRRSCDITYLISTSSKDPQQQAEILRQVGKDDGCHAALECSGADNSLKTAMHVSWIRLLSYHSCFLASFDFY